MRPTRPYKHLVKPTLEKYLTENKSGPSNSHLVEVPPNKYVYHTSNPFFREKISKIGLQPQPHGPGWLSDTRITGPVIFAVNSNNRKDWWDSTYDDDIYRIDTSKLNNKWFLDPNFEGGVYKTAANDCIITFEEIPLSALKLIYRGTGASKE